MRPGIVLFALLWWAGVAFFDYEIVGGMVQQTRAMSYTRTEGQILESRVEEHSDSDGSTYSPVVVYRYQVGSQEFQGTRKRYKSISTSGGGAHRYVRAHPAGSKIPVFYDPSNPSECVLETGIQGIDLLMLMFLTPFNLIGILLLVHFGEGSGKFPDTGGVEVIQRGSRSVARLSEDGPVTAFLTTLLGATFGGMFGVGLLCGFDASVASVSLAWAAILLACSWRAAAAHRDLQAGVGDLVLSPGAYLECWPLLRKPVQQVRVPYQEIAGVEIQKEETSDGDGGTNTSYALELCMKDGSHHRLRKWSDADSAARFQSWLRGQLKGLGAQI